MKGLHHWRQSLSGLTLILTAFVGLQITAIANSKPEATKFIPEGEKFAQTTSDLCRQVYEKQGLIVRQRPTPNSPRVGGVAYNAEVTLIRNYQGIRGPGGRTWIEITFPMRGFISNGYPGGLSNLVMCSAKVAPKPPISPASLCRRVDLRAAPQGLAVRAKPSKFASRVGGVASGREVYLVEDYRLIPDPNNDPRNWVEIAEPVSGFISANSLIMCR